MEDSPERRIGVSAHRVQHLIDVSPVGEANPGLIDTQTMKIGAILLGIISFLISYSVYNATSKSVGEE